MGLQALGSTRPDDQIWAGVLPGTGTVTSIALTMPTMFNVAGTPITTSGTLTVTLANQSANTFLGGPTTGAAAAPTFRALVIADLPMGIPNANLANSAITINGASTSLGGSVSVGTVTSVAASGPSGVMTWSSAITTSGTLTASLATQTANTVFAGPSTGSPAAPTFRALVAADIPSLTATYISTALASAKILVGNASNVAAAQGMSGDASISNGGAVTVAKVNGVSYGTSPATNTVPVVTSSNTVTYQTVPNAALANSAITINGSSVSLGGSISTAGGTLGYSQATSGGQSSITSETDLTSMSVTVTVSTGQRIKITAEVFVLCTQASGDAAYLRIKESTTVLKLTQINSAGANYGNSTVTEVILTPSAGSHTYKLSLERVAGSGTWSTSPASNNPMFILVEDSTGAGVSGGATTLTNTNIFVGNSSNVATDVALSGAGTITNAGVLTVNKVTGITDGSSAAASIVGEIFTSRVTLASPVTLPADTPTTITSITLTAGRWIIYGMVGITCSSPTTFNSAFGGINTTTNALPSDESQTCSWVASNALNVPQLQMAVPLLYVSISGSTTYYLVSQVHSFGGGSGCSTYGRISAVRI